MATKKQATEKRVPALAPRASSEDADSATPSSTPSNTKKVQENEL